jgi:hypothetical protein
MTFEPTDSERIVGDSEKGSARIPCAVLIPSLDVTRATVPSAESQDRTCSMFAAEHQSVASGVPSSGAIQLLSVIQVCLFAM